MGKARVARRLAGTAILAATLACTGPTGGGSPVPSQSQPGMNPDGATDTMAGGALDLRLESVTRSRPGRTGAGRNPFRFGTPPARPVETGQGDVFSEPPPEIVAPVAPPPARRFPLRFIGLVEGPDAGFIAVLTDGDDVYHGRQGDVVDGRYRIVRVAAERVELEVLPAGGRQVLALEGL